MSQAYRLQTPIALFIFNRPEHTARTWAGIRAARPSRLYVIADAPRTPEEAERCAAARAVTEQVDWDCDVERQYADANLGILRRIPSGFNWLFETTERVIFMEDDVVVDASFFPYVDTLLDRYADDERIAAITSFNLSGGATAHAPTSYYYSRLNLLCAIGLWRRSWQRFSTDLTDWENNRTKGWLTQMIGDEVLIRHWRLWFDNASRNPCANWDTRFMYHVLRHGSYVVVPKTNLQTNFGFDPAGTHVNSSVSFAANLPTVPLTFPLVHPPTVEHDRRADARVARRFLAGRRRVQAVQMIPKPVRRLIKQALNGLRRTG